MMEKKETVKVSKTPCFEHYIFKSANYLNYERKIDESGKIIVSYKVTKKKFSKKNKNIFITFSYEHTVNVNQKECVQLCSENSESV